MGSAIINNQIEFVLFIGHFIQDALDEIHGDAPRDIMVTIVHVDRLMDRYDHSKPFNVSVFAEVTVSYLREIGAYITAVRLEDWAIGSVIVDSLEHEEGD